MLMSDVCLSVAYIGPNVRTERPRKTNFGTLHNICYKNSKKQISNELQSQQR